MRSRIAVAAMLAGVIAACTPGDPAARRVTASSPPPAAFATVRCDEVIGGQRAPSGDLEVIGDAVALPTSKARAQALQASDVNVPGGGAGLFAKQGLLVRRGRHVEVAVPDGLSGRFWLVWGSPGSPGARVVVDRCDAENEWIAFAGGYIVREAGCLPIHVRVDGGAAHEVLIGVGAPCPGQGPAPRV
ncbi:hypothetical protein [Microtetraspora sp. NBRC 16547]|uniref:hypothetical protein n=1 Tax=Microtetraspora sp. NBRC 16547 TaxID=3030993 RepID=UPI00255443BC|nr:hypothetical protein [Microtetraspora sp. NBRC 16547]